ncbi:MAG: hypothetical protein HFH43_01315 [Lachnospiraceae bacterium]|nr:hypothetical protein [Lachnospiraceae bacterium]
MGQKKIFRKKQGQKQQKKTGMFYLFHPEDLQKQIDSYGYSFSMGKYMLFLLTATAGAAGCGILFSLRWYFTVLVILACVANLPFLVLDGYKQMYEHKRFLDVSDYMEQILYSFRSSQKIVSALKDTWTLFETGQMHRTIGEAVAYIERGKYQWDLYSEALGLIEQEYPASRLPAIHEFLRTVESNGGSCTSAIDLLLQDKAVWADNVLLLQEDKKAARIRVVFSLAVTMVLAVVFHSVYRSMPEQYTIVGHPVTQIATVLYLLSNVLIFRKANKEIAASWIMQENREEEKKLVGYYHMVMEFDGKAERKKSLAFGGIFWAAGAVAGILGHPFGALAAAGVGGILMNQHKMGYRVAYDKVVKELNRVFPSWLMEMALLMQGNNVQVSIEKTIDHAPAILKEELQELSDSLKRKPDAIEPYLGFLKTFQLSSVQSSMKMLYSISESGSGDAQAQIQILVQRNSKMLDKAEKLSNEKSLAGISSIFYLPQVTVSFQTMVNMVVFMIVFLQQLTI